MVALGCDHFGETTDETTAIEEIDLFLEKGGNVLDTARSYGQSVDNGRGTSEEVIGRYLKKTDRSKVFLVSKGGHPCFHDKHISRLTEEELNNDMEETLRALDTPLDLYFVHRDSKEVNLEKLLVQLNGFIEKGYTKYIGASNWTDERIIEANMLAKKKGLIGFTFSEVQFSLAKTTRTLWGDDTIECIGEGASLDFYEKTGIPFFAYASQGKGIFQKIISGYESELSLKARNRFLTPENTEKIERVRVLSQAKGVGVSAIVLSYITSQKCSALPIVAATKISQLEDTLSNTDLILNQDEIDYLDLKKDTI